MNVHAPHAQAPQHLEFEPAFCQATHRMTNLNSIKVSSDEQHTNDRQQVLLRMSEAFEHLKRTLQAEDLPPYFRTPAEREQYLAYLRNLRVSPTPVEGFYFINNIEGTIQLGAHVLELIRKQFNDEQVALFIQLLILHECIHIKQGLLSSNWRGITNASVVLEDMDYICDSVSIATAIAWDARLNGFSRDIAKKWSDFQVLQLGMFARVFDEGPVMTTLDEGFLRRLLIWNFQYVRLCSARSVKDVFDLLEKKVSVEIQGLEGELDANFFKVVRRAVPDAECFVSHGGDLYRSVSRKDVFNVPRIVDAVMRYDWATVRRELLFFVELYSQAFLIPPA